MDFVFCVDNQCEMVRNADLRANVWTIHDLRRTARSLMSRAGVRSDIAERVMGHAIMGVEGVYDRHSYTDEKADALQRLSGLIEQILNPAPANVVPLKPRR
jgi:integrase